MNDPDAKACVARTLCVMVVVPIVFLAVYPLVYLVLPESLARRADLPQDLSLVLLLDLVAVPVAAIGSYLLTRTPGVPGSRGRRKEEAREGR
jgi:hypothetical protein